MKKIISIVFTMISAVVVMMALSISAHAFSNDFYSIDIGEAFTEESLNESLSLKSVEKDGYINIEMKKVVEGKDYFTDDEIEKTKASLIEEFKEDNFVVDKAEVQTITPKEYRGIYYESHATHGEKEVFFRQYLIYSKKYCYMITVTTYKYETADLDTYKNVVDSFEIVDYDGTYGLNGSKYGILTPPSRLEEGNLGMLFGIAGAVLGVVVVSTICVVIAKKKKKKGKNENQ